MSVRVCGWYRIQLRWEDTWEGASTDLDLYLVNQYTGEVVSFSEDEQSGGVGHEPFETLAYQSPVSSDGYGIFVSHYGGDAPDWIQVVVWGRTLIQHYTRTGGIGNPAESDNNGMLAVGAAPWNDVHSIEPFSSRGPAPDGRVKPDIVGADCGVTARSALDEHNRGFCGTSQASPHVAGMAALVRQRFPDYTPVQVADYLKGHAEQRRSPDPNNTWGHGFAILPPPDGTTAPPVPAPSRVVARNPAADFDTLAVASNRDAARHLVRRRDYVGDWTSVSREPEDLRLRYGHRRPGSPGKEFDTLQAAGNAFCRMGIWSDLAIRCGCRT